MSNHKVFAIFENDGGRLEFAFAYDPQFGAVQLVAPNYQYLAWNWNYEEGEVAASSSWSGAADAAFIEDHDGDWSLDYLAFDGSWDSSTLTFASQTAGFTKTFTLQDDTIYARYTLDGPGTLEPSFGLVANMLNMFEPNWDQGVQRVSLADSVGWQTSAGGLALVNLRDTSLLSDLSFADSPAGDEMREREDTDSYPSGHWLFYPYNSISVYGDGSDGDFGVSLSLDAGVLSRVYLPLVTSQSDP